MAEILGLGGVSIDLIGRVSRMPAWDEVEYIAEHQKQQGGMVATAMTAVSRLGDDAEFIGGIGEDELGAYALQCFQTSGIHCERVQRFPGQSTAFTFVIVDEHSGKKAFFHYKGVQNNAELGIQHIDLSGVRFLHLDGFWFDTALRLARQAKQHGITITLDISPNNKHPQIRELFRVADYIIPSYIFAQRFTGERDPFLAAQHFLQYGVQAVIITHGEEGCFIRTQQEAYHLPAFTVTVIDTTGAGDTFHGAFLVGLHKGYNLQKTVIFASAVAALKCTKLGGQAGIPTFEETQQFLQKQGYRQEF